MGAFEKMQFGYRVSGACIYVQPLIRLHNFDIQYSQKLILFNAMYELYML